MIGLRRPTTPTGALAAGSRLHSVREQIHARLADGHQRSDVLVRLQTAQHQDGGYQADARLVAPAPRLIDAGRRPLTMTFNSMPSLPAISDTPWLGSGTRRLYGVGYPGTPDAINMFALKLRHQMEVTISFDTSTAPYDAVRRSLQSLSQAASLLASAGVHTRNAPGGRSARWPGADRLPAVFPRS